MSEKSSVGEAAERTDTASLTEFAARRRGPLRRYFVRHPVLMDAVVVLVYLLLSAANAVASAADDTNFWPLAAVLFCAAALVFRRRAPVPVLAAVAIAEPLALLAEPLMSSVGAGVWFGLYAVAVRRTPRFSAVAMVLATLPSAIAFGVLIAPPLSWVVVALGVLSNLVAAGFGSTIRRERRHAEQLIERANENAKLARLTERNRIAREMHDVVAHSVSVMIALSDGAGVVLKRDPARAAEVLAELSKTGRTALADMRRVLGVLRQDDDAGTPSELAPLPAETNLGPLLEGFRLAGLPLRTVTTGPALPPNPAFQLSVYRIIQESLTNVLRYAKGVSDVEVAISRRGGRIRIRISDDGRGAMSESVGIGQGLVGMAERASIYAGTVTCGPGPAGGWVVDAVLMWPNGKD